jgi:hypothetical protein
VTDVCAECGERPCQEGRDVCFRCKVASVSLGRGTTPTRTAQKIYKPQTIEKMREHRRNSNAWERGTAIDRRNPDGTVMPILKPNGLPMGLKEYADDRRRIDNQRQKVKETGRLAS